MITESIMQVEKQGFELNKNIKNFVKAEYNKIEGDTLYYKTITQGLLTLNVNKSNLEKEIERVGIMFDMSRGPVFTVDRFKKEICRCALLGIDYIMIYTEDMIEIDVENFGYLRGKYSSKEIKEIVDFCSIFNIEVIPCLQTLGHYENFLRWDKEAIYKDTESVLNVENIESKQLLEKIIKFCAANYTSKTIHIGMDEAVDLGRGMYLKKHGYKKQAEIFMDHLDYMYNLCIENGFEQIIIWSDMLFTIDSSGKELYDNDINESLAIHLKKYDKLKLCFWNYWTKDQTAQKNFITSHYPFTSDDQIICAAGANQWQEVSYVPSLLSAFDALHNAAIAEKQKDLLITLWFDDGGYVDYNTTQLGIYRRMCKIYNLEYDKDIFNKLFNSSFDDILKICSISDDVRKVTNILWDNPIEQLFMKTFDTSEIDIDQYYIKDDVTDNLMYSKCLINFIVDKYKIQNKMLKKEKIDINEVTNVINKLDELRAEFRRYWLANYKIYGMNVTLGRFALLQERFSEVEIRIKNGEEFIELDETSSVVLKKTFNDTFYTNKYRW